MQETWDMGLIPGSGRSPGEGDGTPLQYSCWKNPMEREVWWTTVDGVTKSQTWHCLSHIKGACKFFLKGLHHEYLGLWAIWPVSQQLISITVVQKRSQKMGNKWMWLCSNKTVLNKTGSPACPQAEVCWSLTDLWSVGRLWQREIRGSETTKALSALTKGFTTDLWKYDFGLLVPVQFKSFYTKTHSHYDSR